MKDTSTEQQARKRETGSCIATRTKQTSKENNNSEDENCTKKKKNPPPIYEREAGPSNFFAPLRDMAMENEEPSSDGGSGVTRGAGESLGRGEPPPVVFTSEANLIRLHR
jgi:hypothetical protein